MLNLEQNIPSKPEKKLVLLSFGYL